MPVYQYEGVHYELPDGLSNEQAIAKIKSHLGQDSMSRLIDSDRVQKELEEKTKRYKDNPSDALGDMANLGLPFGVAENALMIPGVVGSTIAGGLGAVAGALIPGDTAQAGFERSADAVNKVIGYTPRTSSGQAIAGLIGGGVEGFKEDLATLATETNREDAPEWAKEGKRIWAAGMSALPEASVVVPMLGSRGRQTAKKTPEKSQAQQYIEAQEAKKSDTAEVDSPTRAMEEMAQQLRAGEHSPVSFPKAVDPMEHLVGQLKAAGQHEKAAQAQALIDKRRVEMEQEVARKGRLAFNAAERVRQEQAPIPGLEEARARQRQEQQMLEQQRIEQQQAEQVRLQQEEQARAQAEQQAREQAQIRAQEEIQRRQEQLEMDMRRSAGLDFNAAERARQENAPTGFQDWKGDRAVERTAEGLTKEPIGAKMATAEGPQPPGMEALMQNQLRQELVERSVREHPFVKKAEERLVKQEELVTKLSEQVQKGKATSVKLAREVKNLENFEAALERTLANVREGVGEGKKPVPFGFDRNASGTKVPFNFKRQGGAINPEVFKEGFEKLKKLDDGTWLRAYSDMGEFRIEAIKDSHKIGETYMGPEYRDRKNSSERDLQAWITKINPEQQGKGLASEMYKFASELGNDVVKGELQTEAGKGLWKSMERKGIAQGGIIPKKQRGALLIDPGQAPQGKFLEDHPALKLPTIVPSKLTPERAIELASHEADVKQNPFQKAANFGTKGGIYQGLKTNNTLVKYTYEKIKDADSIARADIQEYVHTKLAPASRALSKAEATEAWAVINYHDLNKVPLDVARLAEHGFNEKQIHYIKTHREVMDYTFQRINAAREAAGLEPVTKRTSYASMKSTGDYRRLVHKKDEKGVEHIVGVIGSDLRAVVDRRAKVLEEQGYRVGEEKYFGGLPRERGSAQVAFQHALEALAKEDPHVKEFVNLLEEISKQEAYNYLNMKKHTLGKKGIFGMEGRKPWAEAYENAKDGMQAQIDYAEAGIKWGHLSEAVKEITPVLKDERINMPNAKVWSEEYVKNALGYNPSKTGALFERTVASMFEPTGVGYSNYRTAMSVARKTVNTSLLALSPRFWIQNVVQPFAAMPGMKAYLTTKGLKSDFDIGTGYLYLGKAAQLMYRAKTGKPLTALEAQAYSYAKKYHVYGSDLIEHSNSARKGFGYAADKYGNFIAGGIESGTRELMFFAATHMLHENGLSVKNGLFEAAHNLTDMAMNNYSAVERAKMYNTMGPIGDPAVNLMSYKHNELSRIALFARQLKEEKSARPLLVQLTVATALSGLTGMMLFQEADWLLKELSSALGKPMSLTDLTIKMSEGVGDALGSEKGKHVVSHGVFSLLGVDMSKSFGLDAIPNSAIEAAFPGGSKIGDIAAAAGKTIVSPRNEMNWKRLAREVTPPPVAGNMDIEWFSKQGPQGETLGANRETLDAQVVRTPADKMAKRFGFTGIHEAVEKDKLFQQKWITREYQAKRESAMQDVKDALYVLKPGQNLYDHSPFGRRAMQKYLDNQGDVNSFVADVSRILKKQNVPAKDRELLEAAASRSITNFYRAQRLKETFK